MEEGTRVQRAASANKVCPSGLKLLLLETPIDNKQMNNTTNITSILILCVASAAYAYVGKLYVT